MPQTPGTAPAARAAARLCCTPAPACTGLACAAGQMQGGGPAPAARARRAASRISGTPGLRLRRSGRRQGVGRAQPPHLFEVEHRRLAECREGPHVSRGEGAGTRESLRLLLDGFSQGWRGRVSQHVIQRSGAAGRSATLRVDSRAVERLRGQQSWRVLLV